MYDDDVYGARILAELPSASAEDDSMVCNHVIAMQTALAQDNIEWSALDFSTDPPSKRSFRVEFEDISISREFRDMFAEGETLHYLFSLSRDDIIVFRQGAGRAE